MTPMLRVVRFERGICGCLVVRYRNLVTNRESVCVESPASVCLRHHHRNELVDDVQFRTVPKHRRAESVLDVPA